MQRCCAALRCAVLCCAALCCAVVRDRRIFYDSISLSVFLLQHSAHIVRIVEGIVLSFGGHCPKFFGGFEHVRILVSSNAVRAAC